MRKIDYFIYVVCIHTNSKMSSHRTKILIERLKKYENRISWRELSENSNINIDIVKYFIGKPWNFKQLSMNDGIKIEDILSNLHLPWCFMYVGYNTNLRMKHIIENPNLPWLFFSISENSSITERDVIQHPEYPWDIIGLCYNPSISIQFKISNYGYNYINDVFQTNCIITIDDIISLQNSPYSHLINWYEVSKNKYITMTDVLNHSQLNWSKIGLGENPNVCFDDVQKYKNLNIDINDAVIHLNLNDIENNIHLFYDDDKMFNEKASLNLSLNVNITSAFLIKNIDKYKNIYDIINTLEIMKFHEKDIENIENTVNTKGIKIWQYISRNRCLLDINNNDIIEYIKPLWMINRIKNMWLKCYYNPEYQMCRKRLKREMIELQSI